MPGMTPAEIDQLVEIYLAAEGGYLFGFSYADHERFYTQYCDMAGMVDVAAERAQHGSTRRTFRAILQAATPPNQARIIRGVFAKIPPENLQCEDAARRVEIAQRLKSVADRLDGNVVPGVETLTTSETVQTALANAEDLLRSSGPAAAVDRVHTALHGHLKYLCDAARIVVNQELPDARNYLAALINEHPRLQVTGPRREEVKTILRTSMGIVTAVSTIRNNASLAHAADQLLDEHEAMLVINVTKSLLRYLDAKLA